MHDDPTRLNFPSSGKAELPLMFEPQVLRCQARGPSGPPLTVLLDTGTDPSAIDIGLARRLGLRIGEFAPGHCAATDSVAFTETVLPWLRLGDLTLRNIFTLALDLRIIPFPVDIVLGYNVLWQVVLHIDYARRRLHLVHPDLGPLAGPGELLPLTFFEHFPALTDVRVCYDALPLATIDTGSNGGLTLSPDLAARLGLERTADDVTVGEGSGFGGRCEVLQGVADSLSIGPFTLRHVELDTPGNGTGDLSRQGRANIGNRLLARFASVTLDYQRKQCRITPAAP
jgi:hypothetical protein